MTDAPTTPDPIEIAMEAEASGRAPEGIAHEVLRQQSLLFRWQIASERAGFALKVMSGAAGLAAAGLLAMLAWEASKATGVVIKPFSVPPALAARGLTSEAMASRLVDQLSRIAEAARSAERQRGVAADWGRSVSIEIPATGISLAQVEQWLREKLGHERRLTTELVVAPDGRLDLRAHLAGRPLPPQIGSEAELDAMVTRVAEAIYAGEQHQSWVVYLFRQGRWAEARELAIRQTKAAAQATRADGYLILGTANSLLAGDAAAMAAWGKAMRLGAIAPAWNNLADLDYGFGRDEQAYQLKREAIRRIPAWDDLSEDGRRATEANWEASAAFRLGDYAESLAKNRQFSRTDNPGGREAANLGVSTVAYSLAALHDIRGARAEMEDFGETSLGAAQMWTSIESAAGNWPAALAAAERIAEGVRQLPDGGVMRMRWRGMMAQALVGMGRLDEADRVLSESALDCALCVRARAMAAEARGDRAGADRWFSAAAQLTPSLPHANYEWGRARLARGDAHGALEKFDAAHRVSPRFPDAIEGRGEALMAARDAAGAAAAFAEAARLAPQWGRLHLKWGEALAARGDHAGATAQWRTAAGLDLTPPEQGELRQVMR